MHVGELIRDQGLAEDVERAELIESLLAWRVLLDELAEHAPGPWAAQAACRGETETMFPTRGEPSEPAKQLCADCPVLEPCTEWAATVPGTQSGIIAGTSERTRRAMRRERIQLDQAA